MDSYLTDTDMVHSTLHLQTFSSEAAAVAGRKLQLLFYTDCKYYRYHSWLPDDLQSMVHTHVSRLDHQPVFGTARYRQRDAGMS